jgi:hypothetical protein
MIRKNPIILVVEDDVENRAAARLLGIATRTIYRHLERQDAETSLEETDQNGDRIKLRVLAS